MSRPAVLAGSLSKNQGTMQVSFLCTQSYPLTNFITEDKCESYGTLSANRKPVNPLSSSISTSSSGSPSEFSPTICPDPRRASHSRRQPEGYIPRPPNAFFIFRSQFWAKEKLKEYPIDRNHRNISRIASHCWNGLGNEEKAQYQALAKQRKQLHKLKYPNYKYTPASSLGKVEKKKLKEFNEGDVEEKERCRKVAALIMDGFSSSDIQEVMMVNKKLPISYSRASQPAPSSYRRAFNTSLPAAPSNAPASGDWQLDRLQGNPLNTFFSEEFVPTDEIPHLDLSAPKDEQVMSLPVYLSL